jgi:hypothetical protein
MNTELKANKQMAMIIIWKIKIILLTTIIKYKQSNKFPKLKILPNNKIFLINKIQIIFKMIKHTPIHQTRFLQITLTLLLIENLENLPISWFYPPKKKIKIMPQMVMAIKKNSIIYQLHLKDKIKLILLDLLKIMALLCLWLIIEINFHLILIKTLEESLAKPKLILNKFLV